MNKRKYLSDMSNAEAMKSVSPKNSDHPTWGTPLLRVGCLLFAYTMVIIIGELGAYAVRFEFELHPDQLDRFRATIVWVLPTCLGFLALFGQFRTLLSYFSLPDAGRIVLASLCPAAVALLVWYTSGGASAAPRSIILLGFLFRAVGWIAIRLGFRLLRQRLNRGPFSKRYARRIAIIGAGDSGANLAMELLSKSKLRMAPIAFFDDDKSKWGMRIHGIPVLGAPELLLAKRMNLSEVVIATPNASGKRLREIFSILNEAELKFEILPSTEQMVNGLVKFSQIRPVEISDLLGREAVSLETERIRTLVRGKVVMVTGSGGSIGSELCRQILAFCPQRLLLVERCEVQLFQIEQELISRAGGSSLVPIVADILDEARMESLFERFRPQMVFHAAAHKHVPLMEHQPYEALKNNSIGTSKLARLAMKHSVERFVLISSDKAINPTNVMGASKRLAELYLQALQKKSTGTKFMAVRFGNVLGSSGSVIPTFKKQIAAGGPVTVTHPDITRYFMTVQEAVGLVLQSATQGVGGEIFVLDMGKPMKIVDLAKQLIELSGLEPGMDIEIVFTGLRPGEKLFEELSHVSENIVATDHPKIMRFVGAALDLETLTSGLAGLERLSLGVDGQFIKAEIKKLVPEYMPYVPAS
ncbi:MAG TPA: nucleoside-diphosphate sugar epimerase/dehydratase [Opitutaceae bacterium]|nr:nucleoside-diphosphate sugar epimerase/dehydratase [Opitutaceae bacterium]